MVSSPVLKLHNLLENGSSICTDSRNPAHGSIFFALKGESFDGNKFAPVALQNGCIIAVTDEPDYSGRDGYLLVENVLETLQQLANYHRSLFNIPVIGITGSNGKTTTKELLHRVLSSKFQTNATKGNLNNHIGVPLTVLSWKNSDEIAIVEMGANHMGEIAGLCRIAEPTSGIITNIGKAHLEGFGSLQNVALAKGELYDFIRNNEGTLFVNNNHQILSDMAAGINTITYGVDNENHCTGIVTESFPLVKMSFRTTKGCGKTVEGTQGITNSNLTGEYNAENILAAITIGLYFGVDANDIIEAIESYLPENNRSQVMQTENNSLILDSYNANPTSMAAALDNFSMFRDMPRIAILGDMLEMGDMAFEEHTSLAEIACRQGHELLIFVGPLFREVITETSGTMAFNSVEDAAQWLYKNPVKGYRILVKGSRGIQLEKLIKHL